MPKKSATPVLTISTWDACDAVLGDLLRTVAARKAVEAQFNAELSLVNDRYSSPIARLGGEEKILAEAIEAFAIAHRAEFGDKKSIDRANGTLRFRVGNPAVRLINRKWNWDSVLEAIRQTGRRFAAWLRPKIELDKEKILADYRDRVVADPELAAVGIRIAQEESFEVIPNYQEAATV